MAFDPKFERFVGYFELGVLAAYQTAPDKYRVRTDHFTGDVEIADVYWRRLSDEQYQAEKIRVRFGYRTLANGELTIAAFLPDIGDSADVHIDRWRPYAVQSNDWMPYDEDTRFSSWVKRALEGNWRVEDGPGQRLLSEIEILNGLTKEAVGYRLLPLNDPPVDFPWGQNTHRYEDAHARLYGILLDGLDKVCIEKLAARVGRPSNMQSDRTLKALRKAFPTLDDRKEFLTAFEKVSEQRRRASHKERPPAESMKAFEQFGADLEHCVTALRILREVLEKNLQMDAEYSKKRQDAMEWLPTIEPSASGPGSLGAAYHMAGKTVAKVEIGQREHIDEVHESEGLIIRFTDGSIMSLVAGLNMPNDIDRGRASEFNVDFIVNWVPPTEPSKK